MGLCADLASGLHRRDSRAILEVFIIMDVERFDAITKALIRLPRRRLLGGLAAGTLGSLVGLGGRDASAQTCRRSRHCAEGEKCVHRTCTARCVDGDPFTCGDSSSGAGCDEASPNCFCAKKPDGAGVCVTSAAVCVGSTFRCTRQRDCAEGEVCATGCCNEGNPKFVCQPACPGTPASLASAAATSGRGEDATMSGPAAR
jgi:hypothetical protein